MLDLFDVFQGPLKTSGSMMEGSSKASPLNWVAVKELKLSYHDEYM